MKSTFSETAFRISLRAVVCVSVYLHNGEGDGPGMSLEETTLWCLSSGAHAAQAHWLPSSVHRDAAALARAASALHRHLARSTSASPRHSELEGKLRHLVRRMGWEGGAARWGAASETMSEAVSASKGTDLRTIDAHLAAGVFQANTPAELCDMVVEELNEVRGVNATVVHMAASCVSAGGADKASRH